MTNAFRTLIAAAALLGAPALAQATDYPRLVGSGEDMTVEYGPGPHGNIVGGGPTSVTLGGEQHVTITYLDEANVQRRADGRVPVMLGSGEGARILWIAGPVTQASIMAALQG